MPNIYLISFRFWEIEIKIVARISSIFSVDGYLISIFGFNLVLYYGN